MSWWKGGSRRSGSLVALPGGGVPAAGPVSTDETPGPMIDVNGLTKAYAVGEAVRGLTFSVGAGELFVFLGPNGAGKSTTIKMLTGLLPPTAGTARVAGHDVVRDRLALKRAIGYMAEQPLLYDKLTGREFLHFVAEVFGVPAWHRDERTARLLRRFDLEAAADAVIAGYSQGMRQKIALASVLIHQPSVLFLDEPTNGLDPRSARLVKDILREVCRRGATVFMTTHVLEIAEQMCDRVGILHDGRLIALGAVEDLRHRLAMPGASLEEMFLRLTGDVAPEDLGLYRRGGRSLSPCVR